MKKQYEKVSMGKTVLLSILTYTVVAVMMIVLTAFLIKKNLISQYAAGTASSIIPVLASLLSCWLLQGRWEKGKGKMVLIHAGSCLAWTAIWNVILYREAETRAVWIAPAMVFVCFATLLLKKSSKMTKVSYGKMKQFRHI